eukprot:m.314729 g.314729  ORF g.314729 m.314729 type:complete len:207 (-) comp19669_c0_seq15:59-679(-)
MAAYICVLCCPAGPVSKLWYGVLSREPACTENLTPWKRLLPCQGQAGLAALLADPRALFSSRYVAMTLHLQTSCNGSTDTTCSNPGWTLTQRITAAVEGKAKPWTIGSLLNRNGSPLQPCNVATHSDVQLDTQRLSHDFEVDEESCNGSMVLKPNSLSHLQPSLLERLRLYPRPATNASPFPPPLFEVQPVFAFGCLLLRVCMLLQ